MNDIETCKKLLASGGYTCALVRGKTVYTSDKTGIAPLVGFIDGGIDLRGFSVADKIVGKAAALLYAYMGVSFVYGEVTSATAPEVLARHGIACGYGTLADAIIDRRGDGICPMERAVADIDDPLAAVAAVKAALEKSRMTNASDGRK